MTDCECVICSGSSAAELLAEIEVIIARHGWYGLGVPDADPAFVYSVGFHHVRHHAEVVVVGLPVEIGMRLLWHVYDRVVGGEDFHAGAYPIAGPGTPPLIFREVPPPRSPLNLAHRYWRRDFPALQALWADRDGFLPGDPRCDPAVVAMQPNAETL